MDGSDALLKLDAADRENKEDVRVLPDDSEDTSVTSSS